jgi:hypothetical protein
LSLERLSSQLYRIHMSKSVPVGTYHLDITVRDARGENLSQKTRVPVNVLVSFQVLTMNKWQFQSSTPKVMFRRQHYERMTNVEKLQNGASLIQVELDGAEKDTIRFMILENNPGWLAVEDFGGNIYVGGIPR